MAVKLIAVHLPDTLPDEEKDRRLLAFEGKCNDLSAFMDDRGWAVNASMANIASSLIGTFQVFRAGGASQVSEKELNRELAKWEEEKKAKALKADSPILRT